jgi:hypothetical protein
MMYLLIDGGSVRSVKLGKRRLVDVASLTAFAATLAEAPMKQPIALRKGL